jgi:hypothetical protein
VSHDSVTPPSFAVVCVGRVGSEHLVALLDSHSEVRCFGELFQAKLEGSARRPSTSVPLFFESQHDEPWAYWDEVTSGLPERIIGLKLPLSSLNTHPPSAELLAPTEVDVIRIRRANRLAQYVSVVLANRSGVWQSTDGSYDQRPVHIDPERCIQILRNMAKREAALDELASGHRVFDVTYEELASTSMVTRIQEFVGVRPESLTSPYERLRTTPLADVIENYDEIARVLAGTPFAADVEQPG